ncbi:hypothetical protein CLV62_1307 [Dysgonomonas alginatilytica]|uniref:Uncharacterized protein n=2 Tax=Dysgonomonas alginatilytica TaxID=1605892 RepID=A0A2V3PK02_9BACT|nr:hypothetical protein CLV62_1307 [Dysgonomonas alginatilytica]
MNIFVLSLYNFVCYDIFIIKLKTMEKIKLTCPNCDNAVYIHHDDKLMEYFIKTEKVGHQCSKCETNVIINKTNVSYIDI